MIIRIGNNINNSHCQWFVYNKRKGIDERQHTLECQQKYHDDIYVSIGGRAYKKIKSEDIIKL